jgi:hypothetical protein
LDFKFWILDFGFWILDGRACAGRFRWPPFRAVPPAVKPYLREEKEDVEGRRSESQLQWDYFSFQGFSFSAFTP